MNSPKSPNGNCQIDPITSLKEMFVDQVQYGRIQQGQCPARRPVFLRLHGVAHGRFEIVPDLPESLRVGIFGQRESYPAWVRFSSDIKDSLPDYQSTVGIGIKLFDVVGTKLLSPDEAAPTADFILQNMNVFFVDNAQQMCEFTRASLNTKEDHDAWLAEHPETDRILKAMKKEVPTVLASEMWSVIPFRFGDKRYCKYKLEPEWIPEGAEPDLQDPGYLQRDLQQRLANGEARLRFMVQLQIDPLSMPLDQAMTEWSEKESAPIHVATLILPQQDILARGQTEYGETLSFNPWRTLLEHEPVGSIAAARKVVYQASATLRRDVNGQPLGEPETPRSAAIWPSARGPIVRAAIHPGIGIARVGTSTEPDGYFLGPEVVHPELTMAGEHRDHHGALKRQAAIFRLYGLNAAGEVVDELTSDKADIHWHAHLANRKAQWYQFKQPMDIPDSATLAVPLRNPNLQGDDRSCLVIDPGERHISGINQQGPEYHFDSGHFMGINVPLGELRTDDKGRLLVLGGHGRSASPEGRPIYDPTAPDSFNNAADWYDDVSDGPVSATVYLNGQNIPVDDAWAVVAPPNFAPDVIGWRTLYDLLMDTYIESGWLPFPEKVSFSKDVLPALQRLSNLQWVNQGYATLFGKGGQFDFDDPKLIAKLAHRPKSVDQDPYHELRQIIYNSFRLSGQTAVDPRSWPWQYGDVDFPTSAPDRDKPISPSAYLSMSKVRSKLLQRWASGDFECDWPPKEEPARELSQVPLAEQPDMLDKAALHFCLADAFHPGCELPWIMRHASLYRAPFRIRALPKEQAVPSDYGSKLTQSIALQPDGPVYAQPAGGLTRWMALPWQGDSAFCRSGYDIKYDPYLPTYWPARVPNQVLSLRNYLKVMDTSLPRDERIFAFRQRDNWLAPVLGTLSNPAKPPQVMLNMINQFGEMALVEARPGIEDDPDFPAVMFVATWPGESEQSPHMGTLFDHTLAGSIEQNHQLLRAGWLSHQQLEAFNEVFKP